MLFRTCLLGASALASIAPLAALADEAQATGDNTDIVVTASAGRSTQVEDAPASVSVIGREELSRIPYREITDALLEVPGVTVTTGEGNSRDISIRGMSPDYTLILVDGKRLSSRESRTNGGNSSEGGLLPPLEAIERIEVVRGPMSSIYGSDAMGGVVNVITRTIPDAWRGSVRLNGTMQLDNDFGNPWDANAFLSGPITGGIGVQLTGSINRREEDDVIGGTPAREDESVGAKLGFQPADGHRLIVEGGFFNQKVTSTPGKTTEPGSVGDAGVANVQEQERYTASLSHMGDWGFALSNSYIQFEDAKNVTSEKRIKNTVGQSIWTVDLPLNALSLGGYYRNEDLTDLTGNRLSGSTRTGTTRTQWALFAEDQFTILPTLALTGGVRMDDDELYGTHWTPRVYAVWSITDTLNLKGGYSEGFRAPSLRQTLADWGQTSRGGTIYGNPDLQPETSETWEVSTNYTAGRLQVSLSAYETRFHDKITRVTCLVAGAWCVGEPLSSLGRPPTTYVNVDEAKIRGIEATVQLPLTETLRLDATGTLTDSEQLSGAQAGAALNDTPKQQASASLNWRPTRRTSAYIRAIYRGEEAVTEAQISGENIVASSYTTVDIGASHDINRRLTVHGGVQNLFDERLDYDEYAYVIDPIRLWAGVTARF